jgi:hypothetical protein
VTVAIVIDFRKVREDSREVEYRFGPAEQMDRYLVIDKESREGRPAAGTARDGYYTRVVSKILTYAQTRQSWPETGTYMA